MNDMKLKYHGHWWLPKTEDLGLRWFDNPRGERPEVIDAALHHCRSRGVALDCGAHVGTWTVELAKHFAHVHAFEPIPVTWWALCHNIQSRKVPFECATPWLAAVGARLGSCRPTFLSNASMSSHLDDPGQSGLVPMLTLDTVRWGSVSLIKLDVEGCEWHVLDGARGLIEAQHPTLVIEWKPGNLDKHGAYAGRIEALLDRCGYRLAEQLEIDRIYV